MTSDWKESLWGDEISLEYGKALRNYDAVSGEFRVFGSNGPIGWTSQPLASGPGVVLGRKGAYRGVQYSQEPFFVIDTAYYVVPKTQLDMRWLYYAIKHYKLGEIDDGSPIPSTTRAAVYVKELQVPPLPEQKAIAYILGTLDDKIELNRQMNATLEAMAQALFKSWFVDFDPVKAKAAGRAPEGMDADTAAIDVGATSHWVAVPPAGRAESVREFGVFTADLYAIADWLKQCKVKRVALESTGVYWIPLFEVLEEKGLEVRLVDACKVKNVSGRKSDLLDCQWLRQLHSYGLLAGAFRPAHEMLPLRAYLRQRQMLVQYAAKHIQHMQKAMQLMNVWLDNVVTDLTGLTGMRIIKAMLAGERDARQLVEENRHGGCHTSAEVMMQSLVGNFRAEHLFALEQAVELYEEYRAKITACETAIEEYLQTLEPVTEQEMPEPPAGGGTKKAAEFSFEVRQELYRQIGVDLFRLPGFNEETVLRLLSETGRDLTRWPSEKHFASWLSLCPGTKKSGGKVLSSRPQPNRNRAAEALRRAAVSAGRTETDLGAYYRRKRAHKGPAGAVTATAHKLAKLYYVLVKEQKEYEPQTATQYEAQQQQRTLQKLTKQAAQLGYELRAVASGT